MNETGTKRCSYILMLVLSIMLAALIGFLLYEKPEKKAMLHYGMELFAEEIMQLAREESSHDPVQEEMMDELILGADQEIPPVVLPKDETEGMGEPAEETQPAKEMDEAPAMTVQQADVTYFDDALFIGDSRTVGLYEYGDLGNAEVVADTGMSVYKLFSKRFTVRSGEKKELEELLSERQFGKIYIMLGVNELGYDFDYTVDKYAEMLTRIQQMQPDAIVYLQANLHISKRKSDTSDVYNNDNINRFNQAVSGLADGQTRFYLDVNELFDDEEGNLAEEYTADDAHIYAKYYPGWVDWLLQNARMPV